MMEKVLLGAGMLVVTTSCIVAAEDNAQEEMFPFVLPWDDGKPGPTMLDYGIEKPAGKSGFVQVRDGHFYVGEGEDARRLRLYGVNFSFGANFPTSEQAESVVARLAKFGVNSVRFHHMDYHPAPRGIFMEDRQTLDPAQLDRFDYLFAQLKKRGIYGDINLKVSRTYPEFAEIEGLPSMHKGVDLFNPSMIEAQKQYARDLLTHVNPYTGLAYVDDPAVALVEINNENGLIDNWWKRKLDHLPEPFASDLQWIWNDWLLETYGDLSSAEAVFATQTMPAGRNLVRFEPGKEALKTWRLDSNKTTPDFTRLKGSGKNTVYQIRLENDIQGNDEAAEYSDFVSPAFTLEEGGIYTITLDATATPARSVTLELCDEDRDRSDLRVFPVRLDATEGPVTVSFQWNHPREDRAVLVVGNLEKSTGQVEIASVSLDEGGSSGLPLPRDGREAAIIRKEDFNTYTEQLQIAWMKFLWETETNYWNEMRDYLRNELGVKCPIIGTQLGAYSAFPVQMGMDAIDIHVYWKHPQYPDSKDRNVWTVGRESMMEDMGGGTIPAMALRQVEGKPFVCTEYNHVTPNLYGAEAFVVGPAYAAFQDMDGFYAYSYSHYPERLDAGRLPSMFDIDQHPLKMATLVIGSALFLRADVQPAQTVKRIEIGMKDAIQASLAKGTRVDGFAFGASPMDPLRQRTVLSLTDGGAPPVPMTASREVLGTRNVISDTHELAWIPVEGKKSVFAANTSRTKSLVGFSDGETYALGDISFAPTDNWGGWSVLALSSVEDKPLGQAKSSLLVACGKAENTDWKWKDEQMNALVSWGQSPSRVTGVRAKVSWKLAPGTTLTVWALDECGQRKAQVPVQAGSGHVSKFEINEEYQTIWYELEVK